MILHLVRAALFVLFVLLILVWQAAVRVLPGVRTWL